MMVSVEDSSKQFADDEFGLIHISRRKDGSRISIRLNQVGQLKITAPAWLSRRQIVRFVNEKRGDIRQMSNRQKKNTYQAGQAIGKNHLLKVEPSAKLEIVVRPNYLVLRLPSSRKINEPSVQNLISHQVAKILRQQARNYLPERLTYLANKHGFEYEKVRLSHAMTRWGSCTGHKTISLNIVLMTLPNDAIDYVIIHELCHLRHMNHSRNFWQEVGQIVSNYKYYEKLLKQYSVIV